MLVDKFYRLKALITMEQMNTTEWSRKKKRILISKTAMVGCCKGNLGFLERDYSLPKGEMTLDKVLRSPQGKLNTRSRFDGVIHFLENCELNCLLTSSL